MWPSNGGKWSPGRCGTMDNNALGKAEGGWPEPGEEVLSPEVLSTEALPKNVLWMSGWQVSFRGVGTLEYIGPQSRPSLIPQSPRWGQWLTLELKGKGIRIYQRVKWNHMKNRDHLACKDLSLLAVQIYSRFLSKPVMGVWYLSDSDATPSVQATLFKVLLPVSLCTLFHIFYLIIALCNFFTVLIVVDCLMLSWMDWRPVLGVPCLCPMSAGIGSSAPRP